MPKLFLCGAAVLAIAGCADSSSKPRQVSLSGDLKFASCMRSHGVPNFPDPSSGGGLSLNGSGINPQSPSFQGAQRACAKFQPGGSGFPKMSEAQKQRALRFAQCMRANGEPNFPDPSLTPPKGTVSVLLLRGMVFAFQQPPDPQAPAFKQAASRCGFTPGKP